MKIKSLPKINVLKMYSKQTLDGNVDFLFLRDDEVMLTQTVKAEKYINQKTFCDNKLIIVLSDGQPAHEYDDYYGAVANKDTANAAKKIINRGTNIIAVALDDECGDDDDCSTYNDLKEIYPHLVQCKDLKRLTGQILNIVSKQLL